ncbi:16414_t:CDS:2, partial [Entrophospora sp. SA101]
MGEDSADYYTDDGICYVLLILNISSEFNSLNENVALVNWYHFLFPNNPNKFYKYDCPHLKLLTEYNIIPLESIIEEVQIIKRFDCKNEFINSKSISLIMDEIIRTNRELRKQLAEDDEIISKYETRIKSLVRDLENSNLEIHYLDKSLIQREAEIETLKEDNKNLSIQLRKALQDIESKENFIVFREDQFIALEDKISTFNKKPKMSSTRQIQPPNPNEID